MIYISCKPIKLPSSVGIDPLSWLFERSLLNFENFFFILQKKKRKKDMNCSLQYL